MGLWTRMKDWLAPEIEEEIDDDEQEQLAEEVAPRAAVQHKVSNSAYGSARAVPTSVRQQTAVVVGSSMPPTVAPTPMPALTSIAPMAMPAMRPRVAAKAAADLSVCVSSPQSFDDAQAIANDLIARRAALVNFERIPVSEQNRVCDFVNGVSYVLKGEIRRVSGKMVLYVPCGVDVTLMQTLGNESVET